MAMVLAKITITVIESYCRVVLALKFSYTPFPLLFQLVVWGMGVSGNGFFLFFSFSDIPVLLPTRSFPFSLAKCCLPPTFANIGLEKRKRKKLKR